MLAVKNFFLPERKAPLDPTAKCNRVSESFLRSIKRRSLRVKRTKSLVVVEREKRKSDSFVNSQEWTISRSVPDLRLGIVGSLSSGKSALVHRYLTGSYLQEESPEGGRFKKEIVIDNQSYLLLIRDEGGPPEMQFAAWVDAIIYVFSLENEGSFNAAYNYYVKMSHFRNSSEIPIILVGTQDGISERNPRVIDDSRARQLANDFKRCSYYETCATYGLNVERVFQDACQKIVQQRMSQSTHCITPTNSRPTTPQGTRLGVSSFHYPSIPSPTNGYKQSANSSPSHHPNHQQSMHPQEKVSSLFPRHHALSASSHHIPIRIDSDIDRLTQHHSNNSSNLSSSQTNQKWGTISHATSQQTLIAVANENNNIPKFTPPQHPPITLDNLQSLGLMSTSKDNSSSSSKDKDLPTPTSTPTTSRKSRRRSNLFIPSSKKSDDKLKNSELGSGRAIPIKQGYLYKRSSKSLNKEWKKKYVTLCDDGRLTYHSSLHDYMDDAHGKEIPLQYVTVKVPGQKPRGSKSIITNSALTISANKVAIANSQPQPQQQQTNGLSESIGVLSLVKDKDKKCADKVLLTAFDTLREPSKSNPQTSGDEGIMSMSNSNSQTFLTAEINASSKLESQTPNVKKRHRRMKSSGIKNGDDDSEVYEFVIVSLDNKQWHFEAASLEERDEWVTVIEQEIFKSLQGNETSKSKTQNSTESLHSLQMIRENVPGNNFCVDCDSPSPEWASLNLGVLMCIECSGVHRNLGSHISKVRSLGLDDWPPGHLSVMLSIGNKIANSVWEASTRGCAKPTANSIREEKETWIRSKYEAKSFLPPCNTQQPIGQQLVEAVIRKDIKQIILLLAYANHDEVNSTVSSRDLRTPLHLCCATGNLALSQLLIWHKANIKKTDHEGRTCLAYAKAAASLAISKLGSNPPHSVSVESANALVDLLIGLGCPDPAPLTASGTLPRRRETIGPSFEKLPSII